MEGSITNGSGRDIMVMALTLSEVSQILKCSLPIVKRMVAEGTLRTIRVGKRVRVPYADLLLFLEGSTAK
jgi:excisionase family DNA binding protein